MVCGVGACVCVCVGGGGGGGRVRVKVRVRVQGKLRPNGNTIPNTNILRPRVRARVTQQVESAYISLTLLPFGLWAPASGPQNSCTCKTPPPIAPRLHSTVVFFSPWKRGKADPL